eukprot:jgi/Hompol1/1973/HPOL_005033-RA
MKREAETEESVAREAQVSQTDAAPAAKKKRTRHRKQADSSADASAESNAASSVKTGQTRHDREVIKRRTRREKHKERKMTQDDDSSLLNMDSGSLGAGICYRCGSTEHPLSKCPVKHSSENPLPFASCFVCKASGHLSSQCPKNERGVYPRGGCCKHCGSVRHLAKDCTESRKESGLIALEKMDLAKGGDFHDPIFATELDVDDDDDGGAIGAQHNKKQPSNRKASQVHEQQQQQQQTAANAVKIIPKKKVVKF